MSGKVRAFTDGACSGNPGPGGWGAVIAFPEGQKEISGRSAEETTNNRMEMQAIIEALYWIDKRIVDVKRIEILSDSAYVVNAVKNGWLKKWKYNGWKTIRGGDVKNKKLWEELDVLIHLLKGKDIDVRFIKVKGHAGNPMNELADQLAVKEAEAAR